ncbi:RimK-like ATPgrasp N-terminal domain-containing protein [Zavarzinia sp.]|uniref:RimK-like ATPgrasp N-terminal domain-containing protein n=1 Tax=Zavarzinia sp. TaxID=2027920 RepID=UPI00356161EF
MSLSLRLPAATVPDLIVVDRITDFPWVLAGFRVVTAANYIASVSAAGRPRRVVNLCRRFDYLGPGYYCSLLAEGRGDRVLPRVDTIAAVSKPAGRAGLVAPLDRVLAAMGDLPGIADGHVLHCWFGRCGEAALADLAARAFALVPLPLLDLVLARTVDGQGWRIAAMRAGDLRRLDGVPASSFADALSEALRREGRASRRPPSRMPRLAVLHDPDDPLPPSRPETIAHLARIGESMGIAVEPIRRRDFGRLAEFDALFIRETTAVTHHTFAFARRAADLGLPVIDDPASILRCTNKAFLAELLARGGVATPATTLVTRRDLDAVAARIAFPTVLKQPDGAFSRGVRKVAERGAFQATAAALLRESAVVLAQEFLPTAFDWRVGVLGGQVLFAARYWMVPGHWQILRHGADGGRDEGKTEAVAIGEVPPAVLDTACRAAALVGDGFYGVDLKETARGVVVIEVNDNPNLDRGFEDAAQGDEVYRRLLSHFRAAIETARSLPALPPAVVSLAGRRRGGPSPR